MVRSLSPLLLSATLFLAAAGCENPVSAPPQETQTATLDATVRQATLTAAPGSALRLELPPPGQPGHVWQMVQNDTRFLQPIGPLQPADSAQGRASVTFRAMRSGRTQLKFLASAPPPAAGGTLDYYDVVVVVE